MTYGLSSPCDVSPLSHVGRSQDPIGNVVCKVFGYVELPIRILAGRGGTSVVEDDKAIPRSTCISVNSVRCNGGALIRGGVLQVEIDDD